MFFTSPWGETDCTSTSEDLGMIVLGQQAKNGVEGRGSRANPRHNYGWMYRSPVPEEAYYAVSQPSCNYIQAYLPTKATRDQSTCNTSFDCGGALL
jgi:hypothetical protein